MEPVEPEGLAPDVRLLSVGSGREVVLRERGGIPLVLVFHLQGTASAARAVNRAARERYTAGEVTVASVVDLSLVPTLYWGTVPSCCVRPTSAPPPNFPPEPTPRST